MAGWDSKSEYPLSESGSPPDFKVLEPQKQGIGNIASLPKSVYAHSQPSLSSTWRRCNPGEGLGAGMKWAQPLPESKGEGLQEGGLDGAKYPELEPKTGCKRFFPVKYMVPKGSLYITPHTHTPTNG